MPNSAHPNQAACELAQLLADTPNSVAFRKFNSPYDIDLRRSCIDVLFANTIGLSTDSAEWLPNAVPPSLNERLAWIWFVYPNLANDIIAMVDGDFRLLIECYRDGRMDSWWSHMTNL